MLLYILLLKALPGLLAHEENPPIVQTTCWRNSTCTGPTEQSFPGPWDANNFAPHSRTIRPQSILSLPKGEFLGDFEAEKTLHGNGSAFVFDFGIEVGGIITVNYTASQSPLRVGLSFTEAKNWIGRFSDSSNGNFGGTGYCGDAQLYGIVSAGGRGSYTMPLEKFRGGFRYLTIFLDIQSNDTNSTSVALEINDISLEIGFQPTWSNLRAYSGYFESDSTDLNKIWYSGAYTLQTNSAPPETGRRLTSSVKCGWRNDAWLGVGQSILLDGAKRDRWIWPGDMGIAVPSAFVSTGDMESTRNALQTMFDFQKDTGVIPRAGPPYLDATSDTYHMWSMIGAYNYVLYTGDMGWLKTIWARYLKAMDYITAKMLSSGLVNATAGSDWARYVNSNNGSSPNMLTLQTGAKLIDFWSSGVNESLRGDWLARAEALRAAIIRHLWDEQKGAFIDGYKNLTLYPQDSNSFALAFGLVNPKSTQAKRISDALTQNWTPIGPASPELPGNISPFISSIELQAHFLAGRADRALELIRSCWGWYLHHPNGTGSTVIEGYLTDGTFGYRIDRGYTKDPSYVSHAHGWSSGPTSTLTEYLVGLKVLSPAGKIWQLVPAFEQLTRAEAGFTTSLGMFSAKWQYIGQIVYVTWDTPQGTRGWVDIPGAVRGEWVDGGKGSKIITLRKGEGKHRIRETFLRS